MSASTGGNKYCAGKTKDGRDCQRVVGKTGDKVRRYCWQHNGSRVRRR